MPAAVVVPLITAAIGAGTAVYQTQEAKKQAEEDRNALQQQEEQRAANQTVDPGLAKEQELLKGKEKRQKQGFLESFGSLVDEKTTSYGLL